MNNAYDTLELIYNNGTVLTPVIIRGSFGIDLIAKQIYYTTCYNSVCTHSTENIIDISVHKGVIEK